MLKDPSTLPNVSKDHLTMLLVFPSCQPNLLFNDVRGVSNRLGSQDRNRTCNGNLTTIFYQFSEAYSLSSSIPLCLVLLIASTIPPPDYLFYKDKSFLFTVQICCSQFSKFIYGITPYSICCCFRNSKFFIEFLISFPVCCEVHCSCYLN